MRKDPVRFTSQWALIGVILFYTVGTALIARHTKKLFTPASAGGSEYSQYSNSQYFRISEQSNKPEPLVEEYAQNIIGPIYQGGNGYDLMLYDVAFGAEQFNEDEEPPDDSNNEQITDDTDEEKKDAPQELTKIHTKIKCVETILRKSVIEPYCVDGQVKGLQISGLEDISESEDLLLKNGDVIIAVNGNTLSSKKDAYSIFIKARKEPIMIIDLLQNGEPKKFLLDFTPAPLF
ncbi:MAG: hypothetical protein RQ760_07225 [Sedimentisphaerales bacterium]|nr:hypothetical protein [Sedimentisphaerales bacterium]